MVRSQPAHHHELKDKSVSRHGCKNNRNKHRRVSPGQTSGRHVRPPASTLASRAPGFVSLSLAPQLPSPVLNKAVVDRVEVAGIPQAGVRRTATGIPATFQCVCCRLGWYFAAARCDPNRRAPYLEAVVSVDVGAPDQEPAPSRSLVRSGSRPERTVPQSRA